MFDLSFAEVALIVVVAVVFIGPKELPVVVKAIAKAIRSLKSLTGDIRKAFDEVAAETGLKDAADDIKQQTRLITGDDGQLYESYDLPLHPDKKHES